MIINIQEEEHKLVFGMGTFELYCDDMSCDLEGLDLILKPGPMQNKALVSLIRSAIQYDIELKEKNVPVPSKRQIQDWLDNSPVDTLANIMDAFTNSNYLGTTVGSYLLAAPMAETEVGEGGAKPKKKK